MKLKFFYTDNFTSNQTLDLLYKLGLQNVPRSEFNSNYLCLVYDPPDLVVESILSSINKKDKLNYNFLLHKISNYYEEILDLNEKYKFPIISSLTIYNFNIEDINSYLEKYSYPNNDYFKKLIGNNIDSLQNIFDSKKIKLKYPNIGNKLSLLICYLLFKNYNDVYRLYKKVESKSILCTRSIDYQFLARITKIINSDNDILEDLIRYFYFNNESISNSNNDLKNEYNIILNKYEENIKYLYKNLLKIEEYNNEILFNRELSNFKSKQIDKAYSLINYLKNKLRNKIPG